MPLVQVRRAPAPAPSTIASSRNSRLYVTRNAAILGRFIFRRRSCRTRVAVQPRARPTELGRVPPIRAPRPTLGQSRHQRAIKLLLRQLSRQWPWLLEICSRLGRDPIRDGSSWRDAFYSTRALSPACPDPPNVA